MDYPITSNGNIFIYDGKVVVGSAPATDFTFEVSVGASDTLILPLINTGTYDFWVDYGDGGGYVNVTGSESGNESYTYTNAGTYQIKMYGTCSRFDSYFTNNGGNLNLYLTSINQWADLGFETLNFYNSTNLISLPSTGSIGSSLLDASRLFYGCTSLTSLPSSMLSSATSVTTFEAAFQNMTGLLSIPDNFFDNATSVLSFSAAFFGCSNLTAIPNNIFYYNNLVTNYNQTFRGCEGGVAIPSSLFNTANLSTVTTFAQCFYVSNTSFSMTGTVQDIWNYTSATSTECFFNDTALTNYASIPAGWK